MNYRGGSIAPREQARNFDEHAYTGLRGVRVGMHTAADSQTIVHALNLRLAVGRQ